MNTAASGWKRRIRLLVAVAGALTVCLGAAPSSAQAPLATVVVYEVTESITLKGKADHRGRGDEESRLEFGRRLADASLLGKDLLAPRAGTAFAAADFLVARASSRVNLQTGVGPVSGQFNLLTDVDPTRNSLDTLVIVETGRIHGTLDLTTAMQGFARMAGTWRIDRELNGTLAGVFLIPIPGELLGAEKGTYFYLNLGPGSCADGSNAQVCPVTANETLLGIPLTKAVFTFFD